jgi:hypothetical protein
VVVAIIALAVWNPLDINSASPFGGPQPEVPNVQTRTHKVSDKVRNGSTVTIMLIWTRPYTPLGVNVTTSKGMTHFDQQHLPALIGSVMFHDLYDPHVQYGVSAIQGYNKAGPTDCEITIDNVSVDKDRLNGDGLLECWVGARA